MVAGLHSSAVLDERPRDQPRARERGVAPQVGFVITAGSELLEVEGLDRVGARAIREAQQDPGHGETDPDRGRALTQSTPALSGGVDRTPVSGIRRLGEGATADEAGMAAGE